jgi:copper transport protein
MLRTTLSRRQWLWPAVCLLLLCGLGSARPVSAHAILVRASPAPNAMLRIPPARVLLWFSERLDPAFSTAYVVRAETASVSSLGERATHVDLGDGHVAAADPREFVLSLKPALPPAVYLVVYRSRSADDGHTLSGAFLFTVAEANGTVPALEGGLPALASTEPTLRFDGASLLTLLMLMLLDLGATFWVGAQFWPPLVLEARSASTTGGGEAAMEGRQEIEQRFVRCFGVPTLLVLLSANVGLLLGETLMGSDGAWSAGLLQTLQGSLTPTPSGAWWLLREGVLLLALLLACWLWRARRLAPAVRRVCVWVNLALASTLLMTQALTGHEAAVAGSGALLFVLGDWLHLLAASLWVGGMLYLAIVCLPLVRRRSLNERVPWLLDLLARYAPLAIAGVVLMALTGPLDAAARLAPAQLLTTLYGRTLLLKAALVGGLLLTSAVHVCYLRPRLRSSYRRYLGMLRTVQEGEDARELVRLKTQMEAQCRRLLTVLRWEPLLGVAVLACSGLLSLMAGTLPTAAAGVGRLTATATPTAVATPTVLQVTTSDRLYTATLTVSPSHQGSNVFTVRIVDRARRVVTAVGVSLYATLPAMDMGTITLNLQPDGRGNFSASGIIPMGGSWQIRLEVRTPDAVRHEGVVRLFIRQ